MTIQIYQRKSFWDQFEIVSACLAGAAGGLATLTPPASKNLPVVISLFFLGTTACVKLRVKQIEERDRGLDRKQREAETRVRDTKDRIIGEIRDARDAEQKAEIDDLKKRNLESSRRAMKGILEKMRDRYFDKLLGHEKHQHRVTLFICEKFEGASGPMKRLSIFARAGSYEDSDRTWGLDVNEPEKCRGIAGKIWFEETTKMHQGACEWPSDGNLVERVRYAESFGITVEEAERLRVKSAVVMGTAIQVRGEKWGVLLLDSQKPGKIIDSGPKRLLFDQYAALISAVLKEIDR